MTAVRTIKSYEDLKNLHEKLKPSLDDRHGISGENTHRELLVCGGTGCHSSDSVAVMEELKKAIEERDLDAEVVQVGCFGFCAQGPIVQVMPDNVFYVQVKPEDAEDLVESQLVNDEPLERLLYEDPESGKRLKEHSEMVFYKKQKRIALRNCSRIDPESLEESLAAGGYLALGQVLSEMSQEDVIKCIKASGLRGRGGGGFPTGLKWDLCRRSPGDEKYVICNADEGDPGAFMDRSILEGDPHSIVEAMTIAGYACGAHEGLIYIRAEYPLAVNRLRKAIEQAESVGLLGENSLGRGFDFKLRFVLGAGAFVCGEETALIRSCEGRRGEPRRKPPFPAERGFRGKPSNVNNVETLVNIPIIIRKGADWYAGIGTESSHGTKVFALAGDVNNIGLVEVPMGTTLREIVFDIGGGIPDGKAFKAVQTGGPSGGVITEADLDTPIDYESLKNIGSMMGSGGMIVMNEDNDMVDIARFYLEFTTSESCGKCTPCRIGTMRMLEMLEKLLAQKGDEKLLKQLHTLCLTIEDTALCALGQTAPNPVLSTMKYFPEEYLRYARHEVSKAYSIDPEKCIGCTKCARNCPVDAITGEVKKPHHIDEDKCIACGACYNACPVQAISKP